VLADADEMERIRQRLQDGHPVQANEAGVTVRDPSGNGLLLMVGEAEGAVG
jgi:hypothetical protein